MRILVVDDDIIQQQVLACFLAQQGFYVETALTGLEAIRKARYETYHVVLIDQSMPDVDGQSAARMLGRDRGDNRYPWLIAVSANLQQIIRDEQLTQPVFDRLVQKPWKPDHLLALIKQCNRPPPGLIEREPDADQPDCSVSGSAISARYAKYCRWPETSLGNLRRVLLVDDDPALLSNFTATLCDRGYDVDAARSREEALQRISAGCYDIVLADYLKLSRFCGTPADYVGAEAGSLAIATAADSSAAPAAGVAPADQGEPEMAPLQILIVDDNGLNQDVIGSILDTTGHRFSCVDSGLAAVDAAGRADIDVILMDIRMPGVDGLEATRRIRAGSGIRSCVPIIALTTAAPPDELAQFELAGMDGYLFKPFNRDSLISVVTRAGKIKRIACDGYEDLTAAPADLADAAPAIIGADLQTMDREIFDRVRSYLGDQKTNLYLQNQASNTGSLLRKLQQPALDLVLAQAVVDEVHSVGGSAGTFGFIRLLQVSQGFERAAGTAAADIPAHFKGLSAALEATLELLSQLR